MDATYVEWKFGYVPALFAEQSTSFVEGHTDAQYISGSGETIRLSTYPRGTGSIGIDNGHSQYITIYSDEIEYQILSASDDSYPSYIIWKKDGYDFIVHAKLEPDILLDIAFSVRQK